MQGRSPLPVKIMRGQQSQHKKEKEEKEKRKKEEGELETPKHKKRVGGPLLEKGAAKEREGKWKEKKEG